MRGWNQNLEEKFEIVIKFRFERYIIVIGLMTCAEVFIEICFPRLRNVEFDENFDHNIYNLSLIYIYHSMRNFMTISNFYSKF